MPRPPLNPLRFPPFGGKIRFKRVRNTAQGVLYQNVDPQIGLPLWIRYNIPLQYWEYSIDADANTFFRLKENPYIPSNAHFKNAGNDPLESPPVGEMKLYVRNFSGVAKLVALWEDGSEDVIATGPTTGFPLGMISFWKLEEGTGASRLDFYATNNLTDHNSVTQIIGKIGNGAGFASASSQYLDIADNPSLSMGAGISFEFSAWVKFTTLAADQVIVSHDDSASNNRAWLAYYDVALNRIGFITSATGNPAAQTTLYSNTFGAPTTGVWYFVNVYYNTNNGEMGISINRGPFDIVSAPAGGVFNSNATFKLGAQSNTPQTFLNGNLDAVGISKTLFTTTDRDNLYNSGNGLQP